MCGGPRAPALSFGEIEAAREHADTVARELTFKSSGFLNESWVVYARA
jgi:hypothetical protein